MSGHERLDLALARAAEAGIDLRETGTDRWRGDCPGCGGKDRLVVQLDLREQVWFNCYSATCTEQDRLEALGLTPDDLRPVRADDGPAPTLRVLDVRAMRETEPEPVPWLAEPIVARSATTMLAGREGQGKSMFAYALAAASSRGSVLADIECERAHSLFIDGENGEREIHRRVRGLRVAETGLTVVEARGFDLRKHFNALEALVEEHGPDIVVLDSLRALAHGLDENDSQQVELALRPVVQMAQHRDIACVVLHHAGKDGTDYRGSTALGAAIELGFTLRRHPEDPEGATRRKLTCWKSRMAAEPPPAWLSIKATDDGVTIETAEPYDARAAQRAEKEDAVLDALGDKPKSERAISEETDVARTTVQRILVKLEEGGRARRASGGWVAHRPGGGPKGGPSVPPSGPPPETGANGSTEPNPADSLGGGPNAQPHRGPAEWATPPATANCVVLDTETTGLDPRADQLVAVGFAADDDEPVCLRHPRDKALIQQWLALDADYVAHHATFDLGFLEENGYRLPDPSRWQDTMLVAHVAGERRPGQTRLRRLAQNLIELGELPEDTLEPERELNAWLRTERRAARKEGLARPEKGDAPARLLDPYLSADIAATRKVFGHYGAAVNGQTAVLDLERRCLPAVYAIERRGVPLDLDSARELRDRSETNLGDLRARMFELAGRAFNPNAARQVEHALEDRGADLSAVPRTPNAGLPMFTATTLGAIDDELARTLLDWRAEKKLHDYVVGLWKHAHGDRLYGTFRQLGTETGRMSSGNPNLQNIPKSDLRVRHTISAGEGKLLVGADLDSVELRLLAVYAPGGALARAFADGADLHQQTADACGVSRDEGKRLNYLTIYGGGARLVSEILGCGLAEAKAVLDRWYRAYPEVARLKRKLAGRVTERGYIETVGGRRHHFEEPNHMLLNRLISGGCADLFKLAVIDLHARGVPIVLLVHDEVVAEVEQARADDTAQLLERALARDHGRVTGLVAKAAVAQRWSDFKQPGYTP